MQGFNFNKVVYQCRPINKPKGVRNVEAIGFDSEASPDGNTFLYCFSDGQTATPSTLLLLLFSRRYRGKTFVVYNLKYEQGAILQALPDTIKESLRQTGTAVWNKYRVTVVGYKCIRISLGKNSVTFWDMYPFFNCSLKVAAREFTDLKKYDVDTKLFTPEYIKAHYSLIKDYCIRDAEITAELFKVVMAMSNKLGIHPTTFYSIATIAYKYFRENTNYVTAKRFWDSERDVLKAACNAYSGGKFEVVTKGKGHFYEYDINSAYPYEISNLVDITHAKVVYSNKYQPKAVYGFVKADIVIDDYVSHPIPFKSRGVNIFPVGRFTKWVTKEEYEYLCQLPYTSVTIKKGVWLFVCKKRYPYRAIVRRLYRLKAEAKAQGNTELYYFVKILLNAIYGKFVQLIPKDGKLVASTCWQPIYGAIITANVRIRLAQLQQQYPQIVAVHTDSVISTTELPLPVSDKLGDWSLACYGLGLILGSGIYQIGDKVKLRGFRSEIDLFGLCARSPPIITIPNERVFTWKMVVANHWDSNLINQFNYKPKELDVNFDTKRVWLGKWVDGDDTLTNTIASLPCIVF